MKESGGDGIQLGFFDPMRSTQEPTTRDGTSYNGMIGKKGKDGRMGEPIMLKIYIAGID